MEEKRREEKRRGNLHLCLNGEDLTHRHSFPASSWTSLASFPLSTAQKWPHRELAFAQPLEHCGCITTALKGVCDKMAKKNSQKGM